MFDIDVHILTMPDEDKSLLDQCLDSLKDEPINLFLCDGIKGNTGSARANAFKQGSSKYVSFVDPDDYIEPGIFSKCLDVLESDNCHVYTTENLVDSKGGFIRHGIQGDIKWSFENMRESYVLVHHLAVYQRDSVEKNLHFIENINILVEYMMNLLCSLDAPFVHVDEIGYYWRMLKKDRSTRSLNVAHRRITEINKYIRRCKNMS